MFGKMLEYCEITIQLGKSGIDNSRSRLAFYVPRLSSSGGLVKCAISR